MLVNVYGKCGRMVDARKVFDEMTKRDVVTWTCILKGYVENGESQLGLDLFHNMELAPDARTYVAALSACADLAVVAQEDQTPGKWLIRGREIHRQAVANRCCNLFVENMLVDFYSKCGSMIEARRVFDEMKARDVVSWNALLQGYVKNGEYKLAMELFDCMIKSKGRCVPDSMTYVAVITACAALGGRSDGKIQLKWFERGIDLHSEAVRRRCCDKFLETTLVDFYARCGSMGEAQSVFDGMISRDTVSWNCLIQGYVDNGENERALELVHEMEKKRVRKTRITYAAALMACGNLMAIDAGRAIHAEVWRCGYEREVATFLVEFYGKCGSMEAAKQVFDSMPAKARKDVWAWNALMCGYSQQGNTNEVLEIFQRMRKQKVRPNKITFTHILTACSHGGEAELGKKCFESMEIIFEVKPDIIHYNCLVDLLGRANLLDEAVKVVREMPCEADAVTWTALLGACEKWKNSRDVGGVAKMAYEELLKMDERDPAAYNLMANIYTKGGVEFGGEVVASSSRAQMMLPTPCSKSWWTDSSGKVHKFSVV